MKRLRIYSDELRVIAYVMAFVLLVGGAIALQVAGPCWVFKVEAYKNIPARCVKELTR